MAPAVMVVMVAGVMVVPGMMVVPGVVVPGVVAAAACGNP
jgi:hypothetical protein